MGYTENLIITFIWPYLGILPTKATAATISNFKSIQHVPVGMQINLRDNGKTKQQLQHHHARQDANVRVAYTHIRRWSNSTQNHFHYLALPLSKNTLSYRCKINYTILCEYKRPLCHQEPKNQPLHKTDFKMDRQCIQFKICHSGESLQISRLTKLPILCLQGTDHSQHLDFRFRTQEVMPIGVAG